MTGKVVNVIVDDKDNEDDAEDFLIEEAPHKDLLEASDNVPTAAAETDAAVEADGQEHGALVQQILETQKEFTAIEENIRRLSGKPD